MKRNALGFALLLFAVAISLPAFSARPLPQQNNTPMSFAGQVMDNVCAANRSHDTVMKKEGYKNAKECTSGCASAGAKFVLYADNDTVYQLDDQEKPKNFAGQKVTIIGTYDGDTKTIHVTSIQATP